MRIVLIIFFSVIIYRQQSYSQIGLKDANDSLSFWSDVMFHCELPRFRNLACTNVDSILKNLLVMQKLDTNALQPNMIRLKLPDSNMEIFSWQCELDSSKFDYFCFIKLENGKIIQLDREERDLNRIRNEEFDARNWYGAIYYYAVPIKFGINSYYVLFGFAQNSNKEKFKIIETIRIQGDQIIFGTPVFKLSDQYGEVGTYRRQVIKYSSNASCQLQFESKDSLIVYDHIINFEDPINPGSKNFYPDGSYEGLKYSEGTWMYIEKMQTEVLQTAPREKPVLDSNSKDLFGRDRKKKK